MLAHGALYLHNRGRYRDLKAGLHAISRSCHPLPVGKLFPESLAEGDWTARITLAKACCLSVPFGSQPFLRPVYELRLKVNSACIILTSAITPRVASVALLISCWGSGRFAALLPWAPSTTCCTSPCQQFLEHPIATAFTFSLESHFASHVLTHPPHPQALGFTTFLEPSSLEYHNLFHLFSPQSLGIQ